MTVGAILLAGGTGNRFGDSNTSKLLADLNGQPVIAHSALALCAVNAITELVIVSHPDWQAQYEAILKPLISNHPSITHVVEGGPTRRASVWQGLRALSDACRFVVVHDAARPLVRPQMIDAALEPVTTGQALGTSLGIPMHHSLKRTSPDGENWVIEDIARDAVWQVHTPQVFRRDVLTTAHEQILQDALVTDDAALVTQCFPGEQTIQMVADDPRNIKITTPQDLELARAFLKIGFVSNL